MKLLKKADEFTDQLQEQIGDKIGYNFKLDFWMMKIGLALFIILGSIAIVLKLLLFF